MHLRQGTPLERIAADYRLTMAGVHAAMAYYYELLEQIDAEIDAEAEAIDEASASSRSLVEQKLGR